MAKLSERNIVLLSDGTGNSSVSPTKSNVWRLYQTLDLGPNAKGTYEQIAFYDDGVGTSGFRPIYLLGSAFGWGLSRNVRQLYGSLCRHYKPGDKIYIFGFSRGAFTARVLAHFISVCGIIDRNKLAPNSNTLWMDTDKGLRKGVKQAYKSYRRGYWDNASWFLRAVSKPLRLFRNKVLRNNVLPPEEFCRLYSHAKPSIKIKDGKKLIEFIGVWDTVDAMGLPVDELASFLDRVVYPYQFPDQKFSPDVGRACHGLAIDDERQSFHPLLWDESGEDNPDRIKQVWFAGMHSNVGGSYPEDHLAYIALDWMIGEVTQRPKRTGLNFNGNEVAAIKQKAQPLGKMYNSRRGAAVYYRYKPRRIADLCWDKTRDVYVENPKIHHSVLDRIADAKVGYAPTGLPEKFSIIGRDGKLIDVSSGTQYYETDENRDKRVEMLERAQNHIFWRRFSYFCLLLLTVCLVLLPQFWPPIPGVETPLTADFPSWMWGLPGWFPSTLSWLLVKLESVYTWVFDVASLALPAFTNHWTDAWAQSPGLFSLLVFFVFSFFTWSNWMVANTQRITEAGWWHLKKLDPDKRYGDGPFIFEGLADWLRSSGWYKAIRWILVKGLMPAAFVIICLYLTTGAIYRVFVHYPFVSDGICSFADAIQKKPEKKDANVIQADTNANEPVSKSVIINFDTKTPCHNTGIMIEAGRKYTVTVNEDPDTPWKDFDTPAGIGGLENFFDNFRRVFLLSIPARRHVAKPWFILLGEIGAESGNIIPFNRHYFTFTANASGGLYVYVNDAINVARITAPLNWDATQTSMSWDAFYQNNSGEAVITITAHD